MKKGCGEPGDMLFERFKKEVKTISWTICSGIEAVSNVIL